MDSLEELLETQPVTLVQAQAPDPAFELARACLIAGLADADNPIAWLNQVADALQAQAANATQWRQGLPVGLEDYASLIETHAPLWRRALDEQLDRQARDHAQLLALGSVPASYPRQLCAAFIERHTHRLLERFGRLPPIDDALAVWRAAAARRQEASRQVMQLLETSPASWVPRLDTFVSHVLEALNAEGDLQLEERQLTRQVHASLFRALRDGSAQWLSVLDGDRPLPGVWAMMQANDWAAGLQDCPMLLWVHGQGGGMLCMDDHPMLLAQLSGTLAVGGLPVSQAFSGRGRLTLSPADEGLSGLVQSLFEAWTERLDAVAGEHAIDSARARAALEIPEDSCRDDAMAATERHWRAQQVLDHLPAWLLSRDANERQAFARKLLEYQASAARLEQRLAGDLPGFEAFAADLLIARIEADKGIVLTRDTPLLNRPVSVSFEWFGNDTQLEPPPEYGFPTPQTPPGEGQRWWPSKEWETVTLQRLACEGVAGTVGDAEHARLLMAEVLVPHVTQDYLFRTLVALDPLQRYETRLGDVFDLAKAVEPDELRDPYIRELKLLATTKRWQGTLSEQGERLLDAAAGLGTAQAYASAGMRLHWLVITSGEELGRSLVGAAALESLDTGLALLYLPGAPGNGNLIERPDLEAALDHLRWLIRVQPDMAAYVAIRSGDEPERLVSYLRQAAERDYGGYLSARPSLDQTLACVQLAERHQLLLDESRRIGRSQRSIRHQNAYQAHQRHIGYLVAALSIVPGINLPVALMEIRQGAQAVGEGWRKKDAQVLQLGMLSVAGAVLDVLFTAVPIMSGLGTLRRAAVARQRSWTLSRHFAGYEAGVSVRQAQRLDGLAPGIHELDGRHYLWQDGRFYAVYRRPGEQVWRLRRTLTKIHEPQVRLEGARWVMRDQAGLFGGGGRLTVPEQILVDLGPASSHPGLTNVARHTLIDRARQVLANYRFPDEARAVEFAYAYVQDGVAPAWARHYQVGPGTSGSVPAATDHLLDVGWRISQGDTVTTGLGYGGEVQVTFAGTSVARPGVRLQGRYFATLPSAEGGRTRYVLPRERNINSLGELDALIEQGQGPVRISLGETLADAAAVMGSYTGTFNSRLASRFPSMSPQSRLALGEALYQGADTATGLTHRRLHALEQWLNDPLSDPLRELAVRRVESLDPLLRLDNSTTRFEQLRWVLGEAEHSRVRGALAMADAVEMTQALVSVVTARGYWVMHASHFQHRTLLIFNRVGRQEVYVLVQAEVMDTLSLRGWMNMQMLGDTWIDHLLSRLPNPRMAAALRSARRQGLLRTVMGGLDARGANVTEVVWQRVHLSLPSGIQAPLPNWRQRLRVLGPADRELLPGSGLYGVQGNEHVLGVQVQGRWLPVFEGPTDSRLFLTQSTRLSSPLSFDALERCIRESFGEQPWLLVRDPGGWSVRRALFTLPLDSQVIRGRPGLTGVSAQNAARTVFETTLGGEHARLLHLEYVLRSWLHDSQALAQLADPMLLIRRQWPLGLDSGVSWRLALPDEVAGASPAVLYLRGMDEPSQVLLNAVRSDRLRGLTVNAIDHLLVRYGMVRQHRVGTVIQYHQRSTNRVYLVSLQSSERAWVELAFEEGSAVLSRAWLQQWIARLPEDAAQALRTAQEQGRLVRLVATLRLEAGPHSGQVAVQSLADF